MSAPHGYYYKRALACGVPEHTAAAIDDYIMRGFDPGGFLEAVICNDLFGAMGSADHDNRARLFEICQFFYTESPMICRGDREAFTAWKRRSGLSGKETDEGRQD